MKRKSILTLTTFLAITLLFAAFASYKYVPYAQAICGIERGVLMMVFTTPAYPHLQRFLL